METKLVSNAFQVFYQEAPEHSKAWMEAVHKLDTASSLDKRLKKLLI